MSERNAGWGEGEGKSTARHFITILEAGVQRRHEIWDRRVFTFLVVFAFLGVLPFRVFLHLEVFTFCTCCKILICLVCLVASFKLSFV